MSNYPDLAVLKYNTIHGLATDFFSKQRLFAPYRVHSFELLGGYLSYLSGIDAVGIVHLVIAPFFGWLAPLAIARLLRVLTPRYWLPALFIALSFYFIEGSAGRGFANQAFVRLFNGKSVMLTVAVPLLFTYGLRFGSKPTVSRFVLLACSQIAAVGLSSTGIWMAPLITVISVAVALPPRRAALRTFGLSAVSSGYVLLLGLWVVGQMNASAPSAVSIARASGSVPPSIALPSFTLPSFAQLGNVLLPVFGNETTAIAHLSSFALVCVFARTSVTWRLFAVLGFVLSAGLANPFLINAVQSYVTGQLTYERIFWIIPLPIALGIWSTDLLLFAKKAVRVWIADLMVLVVIAGYYFTATDRLVISKANGAQMTFPPMVKMWPQERQVARRVCDYVKNDKYVLAPERVSLQLGSIANCGIPLISAIRWMSAPPAEIERRTKLVSLVGATNISLDWTEAFIESLDKYRISAVVTAKKASRDRWIRELLTQAGFSNKDTVNGHLIWVREDKAHSKALSRSRKIAQTTCRLTSRARYVLAPFGVSRQLALLDKCARPLIAFHPAEVGVRLEYRELRRLDDLVSRKADLHGEEIDWFRRAIENNNVGAVVIYGKAVENQNVQAILNELGFVENIFGKTPFLIRDSWVIGEP